MGGIYNSLNLNPYAYAHQNPVKYTDPSGGVPLLAIWAGKAVLEGFGDVALDKGIAHLSGEEYGFKDAVKSFAGGFVAGLIGAGAVNKIKKAIKAYKATKATKQARKSLRQYQKLGKKPYTPNKDLPTANKDGLKKPSSDSPHTQLGRKTGRKSRYPQTREWGKKGDRGYDNNTPKKDIEWTDHRRPREHTSPHEHHYNPKTGGRIKTENKEYGIR